jgi:DNA-directed RNA polymerase specialized sigma24 family protein
MPHLTNTPTQTPAHRPRFTTTSWTAVVAAGRSDSAEAKAALTRLCGTYWQPLHAFLRRLGHNETDAKDLTQEFFFVLLSKNYLRTADRTKGKFRSFLLTALKHFLANERDRIRAAKRGGGQTILSLDQPLDEEGVAFEPGVDLSPATAFERQWASTLFRQVETKLRREYATQNRGALFDRLKAYLEGDTRWGEYAAVAAALQMSSAAVAMAVHRLRQRYAELLREEVAQTLVNPTHSEIEEELRHLFAIFGR